MARFGGRSAAKNDTLLFVTSSISNMAPADAIRVFADQTGEITDSQGKFKWSGTLAGVDIHVSCFDPNADGRGHATVVILVLPPNISPPSTFAVLDQENYKPYIWCLETHSFGPNDPLDLMFDLRTKRRVLPGSRIFLCMRLNHYNTTGTGTILNLWGYLKGELLI